MKKETRNLLLAFVLGVFTSFLADVIFEARVEIVEWIRMYPISLAIVALSVLGCYVIVKR